MATALFTFGVTGVTGWGGPMYCRMSGCMPGLYSMKASSILYLPLVATKMSPHMASVPQARTALVSALEGVESCQFSPKWSHYLRATIVVCRLPVSVFSATFNTSMTAYGSLASHLSPKLTKQRPTSDYHPSEGNTLLLCF